MGFSRFWLNVWLNVSILSAYNFSLADYCYFLLFPSIPTSAKPEGGGMILAPVPACREDFSRMKLTSFDKLIPRTCGAIKNVRLCCEPDQRPGGGVGTSGVAPDAA